MSLAYLLDNKVSLDFVDEQTNKGKLDVALVPLNEQNFEIQDDDSIFDEFVDDPNYFLEKNLRFRIEIKYGKKLNPTSY